MKTGWTSQRTEVARLGRRQAVASLLAAGAASLAPPAIKVGGATHAEQAPGKQAPVKQAPHEPARKPGKAGKANGANEAIEVAQPSPHWAYLQNGSIRIGIDRARGGAIGYLAASNAAKPRQTDPQPIDDGEATPNTPPWGNNVINTWDAGRYIQQSYYGDKDGSDWNGKPWRYNPVQGGSWRDKPARLLAFKQSNRELYTKTQPRHWATGKPLTECVMEQWITLDGEVARVRFRFAYHGPTQTKVHHQETPAVFVDARYSRLWHTPAPPIARGEQRAVLKNIVPGWPNKHIHIAQPWVAYTMPGDQRGVGVFVPGTTALTCYRALVKKEEPAEAACSYVAPLRTFGLKKGMTFSYDAYFTLGSLEQIKARFAALQRERTQ